MQIHELDGDESECGSDLEGKNASANLHIQAAEMQLVAPQAVKEDFTRMLSTLVSLQDLPCRPSVDYH